jgi:hypothetical protein
MPTKTTQPTQIGRISLIYQIYFLYLEPFAALLGTYFCHFQGDHFLYGAVPTTAQTLTPLSVSTSPIVQLLLTNIAALYFMFAIVEGGILRLTKDKAVWFAVIGGMMVSDLGHIYAVYAAAPERMFEAGKWVAAEWVNYGTLFGGLSLRIAFLLGLGRN